jgi:transcriptional regulator with XRE-family HTH domain
MANERLRAAILSAGFAIDTVADELEVDRKTVERWIAGRRVPYKKHRYALASLLDSDPAYLWPTDSPSEASELAMAELLAIYPIRSTVGNDMWLRLFDDADEQIDILVYAGFWLSEDPAVRRLLLSKIKSGVRLRYLLGVPDNAEVHQRGIDEGIGAAISAKIANMLHNYRDLVSLPGAEFRVHGTVLYNSIYRGDDDMLVNIHLYGAPAHMAPLLHLHRVPGAELFTGYLESFERVWTGASPLDVTTLVV